MAIPSRGIGWSTKANLLWEISKQLEALTGVVGRNIPASTTTTSTTTIGPQSTILTIINNSSIDHGSYTSTFYVIYNENITTIQSGSSLNTGETMSFLGSSTLGSNNVLQLYSNNGLLPFYIDSVLDSVTSNPITYTGITDNGSNSPFVNGITVDSTIAANGITITLIDQPV